MIENTLQPAQQKGSDLQNMCHQTTTLTPEQFDYRWHSRPVTNPIRGGLTRHLPIGIH